MDWERTNALRQGQWSVQLDDSDASASRTEGCQVMAAVGMYKFNLYKFNLYKFNPV
jgi:hypothetical protein